MRTSLDYHATQDAAAAVARAVVTGPALAIPGFAHQLGNELPLELEVGRAQEARPGAFGGIDPGRLAIAAGLTVEECVA